MNDKHYTIKEKDCTAMSDAVRKTKLEFNNCYVRPDQHSLTVDFTAYQHTMRFVFDNVTDETTEVRPAWYNVGLPEILESQNGDLHMTVLADGNLSVGDCRNENLEPVGRYLDSIEQVHADTTRHIKLASKALLKAYGIVKWAQTKNKPNSLLLNQFKGQRCCTATCTDSFIIAETMPFLSLFTVNEHLYFDKPIADIQFPLDTAILNVLKDYARQDVDIYYDPERKPYRNREGLCRLKTDFGQIQLYTDQIMNPLIRKTPPFTMPMAYVGERSLTADKLDGINICESKRRRLEKAFKKRTVSVYKTESPYRDTMHAVKMTDNRQMNVYTIEDEND